MKATGLAVGIMVMLAVSGPAWSEQDEPQPPAVSSNDDSKAETGAAPPPQPAAQPQRFTPSEKIRADDAVPFPVDI